MDTTYLPTKNNYIKLQKSLKITKQGQELLERKRLILTKELEKYVHKVEALQNKIFDEMEEGKVLIQTANIDIGIDNLTNISNGVKEDEYIDIKDLTIFGTEIPSAVHKKEIVKRNYGFYNTTNMVDEAILKFNEIQEGLIDLAILENTVFRLKRAIEKVQKRSNALENIVIPENEKIIKNIGEELEEREREEFARLKVVKKRIM